MPLIDQSTTREILARTDIGSFIGTYVQLHKRGNDLVGLCPFHGEKTPSFHVHPDRGFFKCFGCGAGGDVIKFVERLENLSFPEAIRLLARRAGIEIEAETPAAARVRGEKEQIYAANELAVAYFARNLRNAPEAATARAYVERRALLPATVEAFKIGFAPGGWDGLTNELVRNGVDPQLAEKAGLLKRGQSGRPYDVYRNRLMIPTYATTGEVVAFGGRALDDSEPKYLNTSTTPVYTKGRGVYALNVARRAAAARDALIVVEGYLDCIALHQAGFTNAVASLGTAFTAEQAAELRKYAQRIFLCFDADDAGRAATAKAIGVLREAGCTSYVVRLPHGDDPDTYVRSAGAPAFQALLEAGTRLSGLQFVIDLELDRFRERRLPPSQAARAVDALLREQAPREERDTWLVYAANRLGLSPNDVRSSAFASNPANFAPRGAARPVGAGPQAQMVRHVAPAAEPPPVEREILAALIDEPALVAEYGGRIAPGVFRDTRYRGIYERLTAHAAKLALPSDVFALLGDDAGAIAILVNLQKPDRSSRVRFPDSAARRAHLDRVIEGLTESRLEERKRELSLKLDAAFHTGIPVSPHEKDEYARLVEHLEQRKKRRLGTR
jgi:DNA primase